MSRARRLLAAVLVAIALPVVPAVAEHEVYYRFTVLGYVKDAQGKPIADATVEVTRDKTAFSYLGQTDAEGFYFVRARLGDESRGEVLTVRQGPHVRRVFVIFDPRIRRTSAARAWTSRAPTPSSAPHGSGRR